MFNHDHTIRVRYGETDKMGYLYYGYYALYYEVARVEALRSLGISYKSLEDSGIQLPVVSLECTYLKPAYYDEELKVRTTILKAPHVRFICNYEVYNGQDILINVGKVTLVFFDPIKQRPRGAPQEVIEAFKPYFKEQTPE